MRAARLLPLAALVAALFAPASAQAAPDWHDAGANIPSTVDLHAVARSVDTVIAVGYDNATAGPAIYRFDGTAWWRDTLPAGTKGKLLDVAATPSGAWAVGSDGASPLLVHLPPPAASAPVVNDPLGTAAPAARQWIVLSSAGAGALRTLSMSGGDGYAGDATGKVWKVSAAGLGSFTALDRSVNGVAHGQNAVYAVTDGGLDPGTRDLLAEDRIFKLDGTGSVAAERTLPDQTARPVLAVAARGTSVLAVDPEAYWRPNAVGVWERSTTGLGSGEVKLSDVALGDGVSVLGGRVGGDGYVWRAGGGSWSRRQVASAPVNGVLAVGTHDVWAAGDRGTLLHYHEKLPASSSTCTSNCAGGGGGGTGEGTGGAGGSGGDGANAYSYGSTTTSSGNTSTTVIPAKRKGDPTIYIVEPKQPASKRRPAKRRPRRLVDRVKVLRQPKRLVITFRLRAPARVAVSAQRGRAVVSRARSRAMRAGRRRVVLPFRGKPPTQLRIVVRPLSAKQA